MNILQLAQIVIGSIASLGVLIAGAGYGIGKFLEGKNKASQDTIKVFTDQISGLNAVCEQQAKQILTLQLHDKDHTQEIGRLGGVIEEKEKKIKEMSDILANRDPQLSDFIKMTIENNKIYKPVFDQMIKDIGDIKNLLNDKRVTTQNN